MRITEEKIYKLTSSLYNSESEEVILKKNMIIKVEYVSVIYNEYLTGRLVEIEENRGSTYLVIDSSKQYYKYVNRIKVEKILNIEIIK